MNAAEERTFFRGKEFSRLLVLGVFLLGFGPLAIYYGYVRRPPDPPLLVSASSIPPLPPADTGPEFALLRDGKPKEARDDDAWETLFKRVREDKPPGLATLARKEVTIADLILRPKRHRGLPVRIEGYATQVFVVDDRDTTIVPGGRIYEVWFYDDRDNRKLPWVLYTETVPKTLPAGRGLNERIAVEGYFVKAQLFVAADRKAYNTPALIGRLSHEIRALTGVAARENSSSWIYVVVGIVIFYVVVRVVMTLMKAFARRRLPERSPNLVEKIEPADLNRWLESNSNTPEDGASGKLSWDEPSDDV